MSGIFYCHDTMNKATVATPLITLAPLYLDRARAAEYLSISVSQFETMVARGDLPPPRQLSAGRVAWLVSDLTQWGLDRPISSALPPVNSGYGRAGKASCSKKSASLTNQ